MILEFDYYGDFSDIDREDLCFGAMEFDSNGEHYIIDIIGETDYDFENNHISGRTKGEYEFLSPDINPTEQEVVDIIKNMDKSTFRYNLLDDGEEPEYRKLEASVITYLTDVQIEKVGKQSMTVREFFDRLRDYPDWNKDIVIENKQTKMFDDIVDIICDERNGNLIIVKREN